MSSRSTSASLAAAAKAITNAEALIFTSGAGLSVDSGLPDFRGPQGFWRAYPIFKVRSLQLEDVSNPTWFLRDPHLAWGFFGHRHGLYRAAVPHDGYGIMRRWGEAKEEGYFVYTSNVDGQYIKAGFDQDRILECHGSIHFHQCVDTESYGSDVWPAPDTLSPVDMATLNMADPLPTKPGSEGNIAARPNILMFNDYTFSDQRIDVQYDNLNDFMAKVMEAGKSCCVIEVGAGTAIPTIRMRGEQWARQYERVTLVRINPGEFKVPKAKNVISIPLGGLDALRALDALVSK